MAGMKWGVGYLSGKHEAPEQEKPEHKMGGMEDGGGEEHHGAIHEHLKNMHEMTGKSHSHVEHHGDGSHSVHHVDEGGQVSGPHEHEDETTLGEIHGGGEPQEEMQ